MDQIDPEEMAKYAAHLEDMLDDRDYAYELLPDLDYDAQLTAISQMLRRNAHAEVQLSKQIAGLKDDIERAGGDYVDFVEGQWVDAMHSSVFHDAASSMAAVGMIAPFVESVFTRAFIVLGQKSARTATGARLPRSDAEYWNCKYYFGSDGRREDVALGIKQLATDTGLAAFLDADLPERVEALFSYRNHMFHNGFEWPLEARARFARVIAQRGWSAWFSTATTDDAPWVFYLSEESISYWSSGLGAMIDGIGRFVRDKLRAVGTE